MSKFSKINNLYNKNKNNDWKSWLEHDTTFCKPGKQGIVGLLKCKDDNDFKIIFKISQCTNYLVNHELVVMNSLNTISTYCPHFCKVYGKITTNVEPNCEKGKNPFGKSKYSIEKDVLLCEYIKNASKMYNYIRKEDIDENILYSLIKQILLAICIAQKEKKLTHYDLHSFNIMVKKCDTNLAFLYVIDEENQFLIPTLGYYPVIIDYGFSYVKDMDDNPLWTSLAHTEVGFTSDRFDPVSDPKLFLITVSEEIKGKRGTKKSKILRKLVRNLFKPLNVDFECGWDVVQEGDKGAIDYVCDMVDIHNKYSRIFDDYDYYCFDIIQSLIILPLQEQKYDNITESYKTFLKEFAKIENEISNSFYNIYLLKEIVDIARMVRPDYLVPQKRNESILTFKKHIYQSINKVTKFCVIKDINFEKMLCSLLLLAKSVEGVLYSIMEEKMAEKYKEYADLKFQNIEEIYGLIETEIPDEYVFTEETEIMVIDNIGKKNNIIKLTSEQVENINDLNTISRGCYIYDEVKF